MKMKNYAFLLLALPLGFSFGAFSKDQRANSNRLAYNPLSKEQSQGFSGDMRLRYQHDGLKELSAQNTGYFIRIRSGWSGSISDKLRWDFRLASGGWVNPNQDKRLGGFGLNPLWFDVGSISYLPSDNTKIQIGKMANPYFDSYKYNLIWDRDLNPEGISAQYKTEFLGRHRLDFNLSVFLRDPLSKHPQYQGPLAKLKFSDNNRYLSAGSVELLMDYDHYNFRAGSSFYYLNSKGEIDPKLEQGIVANSRMGQGSNQYLHDYSILDVFFQMDLKSFWKPLSLSFELIQNFSVDTASMGISAGGILGDRNKVKSWTLGYNYFRLDKDAVLARYTDSDIGGKGIDYAGHQLNFNYLAAKYLSLGLKYIMRQDNYRIGHLNHIVFGSMNFKF